MYEQCFHEQRQRVKYPDEKCAFHLTLMFVTEQTLTAYIRRKLELAKLTTISVGVCKSITTSKLTVSTTLFSSTLEIWFEREVRYPTVWTQQFLAFETVLRQRRNIRSRTLLRRSTTMQAHTNRQVRSTCVSNVLMVSQSWPRRCSHIINLLFRVSGFRPRLRWAWHLTPSSKWCFGSARCCRQ